MLAQPCPGTHLPHSPTIFLSTYHAPDVILGTGDTAVNKTKSLPSWDIQSSKRDREDTAGQRLGRQGVTRPREAG